MTAITETIAAISIVIVTVFPGVITTATIIAFAIAACGAGKPVGAWHERPI